MIQVNKYQAFVVCTLLSVLGGAWGQRWTPKCPSPCRCSLDRSPQQTYSLGPGAYKLVDCRYGNIFAIPKGLPADTQVLLLSNNFINTITPQQLEQVPKVKKIDLSHNYLTEIAPGTFRFNVDLNLLNLGWNQLTNVANNAFDGLSVLSRLLLSSNQLKVVPTAVQNMVSLVLLELSRNQIVSLNSNSFTGLQRLQFLNLRSNQLERVAPQTFSDLPSLVNLHLTANKLKVLPPNVFRNLHYLADISLGMNDLEQIPANLFRGLPTARHIDLHNNKLVQLPPNLFQGMTGLQEIDLDGNNLHRVPAELFRGLVNLRSIELTGNDLLDPLPPSLFYGLQSLESVEFQFVQNIPSNIFQNAPQLTHIEITDSDMPILYERMFQNLPNLQSLVLSDNGIGLISPGMFRTMRRLNSLDLSANAITSLNESTFGYMPALKELFLQDNLITSVSYGAFSGLSGMQTLRLDVNFISELRADALPGESLIKTLQLAENPIERVDVAMLTKLPALAHMTMDSRRLICDCHASGFGKWLQRNLNKVDTSAEIACGSPSNYRGRPFLPLVNMNRNPFHCVRPTIRTLPRKQQKTVTIGATFKLPCERSTQAAARTRWQLPNRPGLSVPSYRREPTYDPVGHLKVNGDGSLVVYNATASDSGTYQCSTYNAAGTDSISYAVAVLAPNAPTAPGILPKNPPVESTAMGNTTYSIPKPNRPTIGMSPTRVTGVRPQKPTAAPSTNKTNIPPTFAVTARQGRQGSRGRSQSGAGARTTQMPLTADSRSGQPKMADRTLVPTFGTWTSNGGQNAPWGTDLPPIFEGSTNSPGPGIPKKCKPNPCQNGGTCSMLPAESRNSVYGGSNIEEEIFKVFNNAKSRKPRAGNKPKTKASAQARCTCPKQYGGAVCSIRKPGNPTQVSVVESGNNAITLSWSGATQGEIAGYRVFYTLVGDRTVMKSIPIHPDVNLFAMSQLKKDSTYRICVIAFNQGGESAIGEENCIWAETVTQSAAKSMFSTQFIAIASGIVSVFAVLLIVAYCYLRTKKKRESYDEAVVVPRPQPRPSSAAADVFRKSLRRPVPSYYSNMDDMMLIDMNQQTNRNMYMNPFDARHSAMLHDMESRRQTQSYNSAPSPSPTTAPTPKIFKQPNNRRTLRIQEDTVL